MLPEEAEAIGRWLSSLEFECGSVCLNLGSSTREFRTKTQPFIQEEVLAPLERSGCKVVNCDLKKADGVDEVGDLLDADVQRRLSAYQPDLVICSNLLEHLTDPGAFARACGSIVKPGGYCLFTVPRSFPYHLDPIDTMYRPSPESLAGLLPGWEVIRAEDMQAGSFAREVRAAPSPARLLVRQLARALTPFYRPRKWLPEAHKLLWLFRPYRVSLALLKKPIAV